MARETPPKTVPELVEPPSSYLCVTSIGAAIYILTLNHADVIVDQSRDAVTQNAWFRCALCAAISGEISILIQTGAESWGRFPVPRICRWESKGHITCLNFLLALCAEIDCYCIITKIRKNVSFLNAKTTYLSFPPNERSILHAHMQIKIQTNKNRYLYAHIADTFLKI